MRWIYLLIALWVGALALFCWPGDQRELAEPEAGGRRGGAEAPGVPALPSTGTAARPAERPLTPAEVRRRVRSLSNPTRPLALRAAEVRALADAGSAGAVHVLLALGDADTYLSWAAVEALGSVDDPERRDTILAYLKGKLTDRDSRMAEAAIRAHGRLGGEAAVPDIAAAMRLNRSRSDGYAELVNTTAARTLGDVGSAAAVPALTAELDGAGTRAVAWDHEYGSELVAALGRIGGAEAREAIRRYARWLGGSLPSDPMARRYVERKINEARSAGGLDR